MRCLLLSDIHSNLEALQSCLEQAAGKYDLAVCLGDLVGYGPNPNEAIDQVRTLCSIVIRGNHDKACCGILDLAEFNPYARAAVEWTRENLTVQNYSYLRSLPMGPVRLEDSVLVHGSPGDEDEYILGPVDALPLLRAAEAAMVCFGHTHIQGGFTRSASGRFRSIRTPATTNGLTLTLPLEKGASYLINPGSVGQPRDHDPRAGFAIIDFERGEVHYYRASYPLALTQAKMAQAGLPPPLYRRLELGR